MNDKTDSKATADIVIDHLKGIRKESKKAGVSRLKVLKAYLKAFVRYSKELKDVNTDEDFLKFHIEKQPLLYDGDMREEYRSLHEQSKDRYFFCNVMLKYYDKLVIEEAVKMGVPEDVFSAIVKDKNLDSSQKLVAYYRIADKTKGDAPVDEEMQKQWNHNLPEDMIMDDGPTPDKPREEDRYNEGHNLPDDMIAMFDSNETYEPEEEYVVNM